MPEERSRSDPFESGVELPASNGIVWLLVLGVNLAFLGAFAFFALRTPQSNFAGLDPDQIRAQFQGGSSEATNWNWSPRLRRNPGSTLIPACGLQAALADERLLTGCVGVALEYYEAAALESDVDVYARFMRACLYSEQGRLDEARAECARLLHRWPQVPMLRLLDLFVEERARQPQGDLSRQYLVALDCFRRDWRVGLLPWGDHLHDIVQQRLYQQNPPLLDTGALGPDERAALAMLEVPPDLYRLQEVVQQAGSIALTLLALTQAHRIAEGPAAGECDAFIDELLAVLERLEPDNAYFPLLRTAFSVPELLREHALRLPAEEAETEPVALPPEFNTRIVQATRLGTFDSHAVEIYQLLEGARRRSGDPFAAAHVPPPHTFNFLGDLEFPYRYIVQAADGPLVDCDRPGFAFAALLIRSQIDQLPYDPLKASGELFNPYWDERLLRKAAGLSKAPFLSPERFRGRGAVPMLPLAIAAKAAYLYAPLPIPSLFRAITERYHCDTRALVQDLERMLNTR